MAFRVTCTRCDATIFSAVDHLNSAEIAKLVAHARSCPKAQPDDPPLDTDQLGGIPVAYRSPTDYVGRMPSLLVDRLASVANHSTLRLTHYGRRSGKPYEVTIWFMVEGETIYLVTANRERQWPRNVAVRPAVALHVGSSRFTGNAEPITEPATIAHVTDLMATKYWYTRPYVWLARLFGRQVTSAAFRVRLDAGNGTSAV
jgi:deazaflavin-dependent oxidoreductase (nitroreductase family)